MIVSRARGFGSLFAHGRGRAVVLLVAVAGVLTLAPGAARAARASGSETITSTILFPVDQIPSTAPVVGTFSGTFSASGTVSDAGTVTDQALFGAVPSPAVGVLQQTRTYSGSKGTLTLRCTERIHLPRQTANARTIAGSCVVLDATGAYAGLRGSGKLTGKTSGFLTNPFVLLTVQDTLVL